MPIVRQRWPQVSCILSALFALNFPLVCFCSCVTTPTTTTAATTASMPAIKSYLSTRKQPCNRHAVSHSEWPTGRTHRTESGRQLTPPRQRLDRRIAQMSADDELLQGIVFNAGAFNCCACADKRMHGQCSQCSRPDDERMDGLTSGYTHSEGRGAAATAKQNAQRVGRSQEFLFAAMRFGQHRHVVATAASQFSHFFLPLFACAFFPGLRFAVGLFLLLLFLFHIFYCGVYIFLYLYFSLLFLFIYVLADDRRLRRQIKQ